MFSQLNLPLIASSLAVSWIVGVAIHELGHAVAGRLAGVRISACGIGFHPWWHVQVFGIRFYVGWPLTGGLTTFLSDDLDFARGKVAAMIAGGPLANLLSALVAGWLWWLGFLPGFVPEFCVMSALLATNGLVPFSVQKKTATFRTDVLLFAQLCRGTHHRWADSAVSQRCRSLLRRGGARSLTEDGALGLLTAVARVCAERGDDHNARQFFAKALDAISRIAAHIPGEQTRQRFLKSKGDALRRAAIAGDGVPAFVPELTEPRRPRVHLSKVGLSLFAAGLMIGALGLAAQFVKRNPGSDSSALTHSGCRRASGPAVRFPGHVGLPVGNRAAFRIASTGYLGAGRQLFSDFLCAYTNHDIA